jgi:endonuclease/exonuclease/phosphatase family metal-dependent hydrolase
MHRARVMTWNLWWRFGNWRARQEGILRVLSDVQPDVCGLQEVWAGPDGNQAETLARELGLHWVYAPSPAPQHWQRRIGDGDTGVGDAVLSRWPLTGRHVRRLPEGPGEPDGRSALHVDVQTPAGVLPFVTTHLSSAPGGSALRCEQVRALAGFVAAHDTAGLPAVVTGDLNAEPDSDEVRLLCGSKTAPAAEGLVLIDAWRYSDPADPGWTWDRRNPHLATTGVLDARIDYVLVGLPRAPGRGVVRSVAVVGHGRPGEAWPSDHLAVRADLQL